MAIMKRLLLFLVLAATLASGQTTSFYTDRAVGTFPVGSGSAKITAIIPVQFGQVRVCSLPLTQFQPCLPLATITDINSNPISNSIGGAFGQITTDVVGRFTFGCQVNLNYQIQVAPASSNVPQLNYPITCPGTGATPAFTTLVVPSFNHLAFIDGIKYPCTAAGINQAISDVSGGVSGVNSLVDARGCGGMNWGTTTVTVGPNPGIWLWLGSGSVTCTSTSGAACISVTSEGGGVIGQGMFQTRLRINNATGDGIQINALFVKVADMTIDSLVTRTAGAGIHNGGLATMENLRIERTFYGILLDTSVVNGNKTGNNSIINVTMGSGGFVTGNWQSGIYIGANDIAANSIADTHVQGLRITLDLAFAGAGLELNGGTDSFDCMMCSIGGVSVDSKSVWIHNSNGNNNYPRYSRFVNSYFEAGPTKDAITVNGGNNLDFVNDYAANAHWAILINPDTSTSVKGFHYLNGVATTTQNECIFIGGTPTNSDIQINHNQITDCGSSANNTFANIFVSAPTVGLQIIGNDFHSITGQVNLPSVNINIATGATDKYTVADNSFGSNVSGSMLDAATGINKRNGPNWPLTPTTDYLPIGKVVVPEIAAPTNICAANQEGLYADSTSHDLKSCYNNGSLLHVPQIIANGTAIMTTAAIAAGACGTTVTVAAAGVTTTDVIAWAFNAAPGGQNAGLVGWPTAGNVNFAYCSNTAETPAAATINWRVVR